MSGKLSQAEENKILKKIINITNSELALSFVLQNIVDIVSEISKADSVFIYLFDSKKNALELKASKIPHTRILNKINLKLGEGITGWAAKENKPVSIPKKAYNDVRFKNFDILAEDKFESFLSIPIIHKGITGVINVQHKAPYKHSLSLINLLTTIAKQVGGVIENARLYEEKKLKAQQFDTLVKISETITSEKYLDEILNLIVVVTSELLNSKICSIMLLDDKGEWLIIKATQSLSEAYKNKPPIKVEESLSGEVIKEKKSRVVYDVRKENRYIYKDLAIKEGLSSMMLIPMIVKHKAIGIINVYTKTFHNFSKEEIDILQIIANQAAVAIENTKLMEEAIKSREALETRKIIERAKGILMKTENLSEDIAYRIINKKSMDTGRSMRDIADAIILMYELKKSKKS